MSEITTIARDIYRPQVRHIEEFAAAYFQKTHLDPQEAKLVLRQTLTDTGIKLDYWFEPFPSESEIEIYRKRAEAAERGLAALKERMRWRKYPDEKPDDGDRVLILDLEILWYEVCKYEDGDFFDQSWEHGYHRTTHWQPLPEPPEAEND